MKNSKKESPSLIAALELEFFRGGKTLLNPRNLNYVPEYYLLENLSSGLVFEDWRGIENFEPRLAERWEQLPNGSWIFYIGKDSLWSDGTPLTLENIASHFERISKESSRHLSLVRKISSIEVDAQKNAIILNFETAITEGLLHDLSLADAMILNPKNLNGDWTVTSGPYFVDSQSQNCLVLKVNPHFKPKISIETVSIYPITAKERSFDVLERPAYAFRSEIQGIFAETTNLFKGYPTDIYYFHFPKTDPRNQDIEARRAFHWFIQEAFANFKKPNILITETQMIPQGFSGRLQTLPPASKVDITKLRGKALQIELNEKLRSDFPEPLFAEARKQGIELKIVYSPNTANTFASFTNFVGNQRDPLSSWRFLYGEGGPLHRFYPQVEKLFEEITTAGRDRRKELLLDLHRQTLDQVYAAPFMAEHVAILSSKRVDLSAINPFDMRLRFFEMKWKS